jgi:hypothetical protein
MARGYDEAKDRKNKVSLFGKTLVRRIPKAGRAKRQHLP